MKKKILKVLYVLFVILIFFMLFIGLLAYTGANWYLQNYTDVPFAQVLYHVLAPLEGANVNFLDGFEDCFTMPVIVTISSIAVFVLVKLLILKNCKKIISYVFHVIVCGACVTSLCIGLNSLYKNMGIDEYIINSETTSNVYEDYYVNGRDVNFTFPEKKRNLIYIYLESMETTFEGSETGGLTDTDYIPELTKLQQENLVFDGGDSAYNGFYVPGLCGWTVAAIVGQTSGTPLNVGHDQQNGLTNGDFLPNAYSIGEVLEQGGYNQEFLCGSDINFGGRKNYFDQHGNYKYFDIATAKEEGYIDEDYGVWWGYEDSKLIDYAKIELTRLASEDEPFNFTMLTADTHFPYGYECEDCGDEYDKNYSNVLSCSSKRIGEFVEWIQEQDFYDNTTIVIVGDHLTMDSDWFEDKDTQDYKRKGYYVIINSAIQPVITSPRTICTFDLYPTTLAAMGVQFDSDRLGFGTNLFTTTNTVSEVLGFQTFRNLLYQHSDYYDYLFNSRDDLFIDENATDDTQVDTDVSWQVPTFYDGDVYDYSSYYEPSYSTPDYSAEVPSGTTDDSPQTDPGGESGSGQEGGQGDPGTVPEGEGQPVEPSEPIDPVTPAPDEGSVSSQTDE